MTIKHLKVFITVANCGNMHKAAEKLYITQPAISQSIKELENFYNVPLFDRLSKKLMLTTYGAKLYDYSVQLLSMYEQMNKEMLELSTSPIIRIGGSISAGTVMLKKILKELEKSFPSIDIRVDVYNTSVIEEMILRNQLDVAIVEGIVKDERITQIPVYEDELVLLVGKDHPLYSKENIKLKDLDGQNFISREGESVNRNYYDTIFKKSNISLITKWGSSNTETIKQAIIDGYGVGLLSNMLVIDEVENNLLKVLPISDVKLKRSIHLIYHKDKYITPQINMFMEICKRL